jgi:hypothetical protein
MNTLQKIPITLKIIFAFLFVGLTVIGVISWQIYSTAQAEFFKETSDLLVSIRENKKNEIENYFKNLRNECLSISESTMTFDAMHKFDKAFQELQVTPEQFEKYKKKLTEFYEQKFLPQVNKTRTTALTIEDIFPNDEKTIILQTLYIAQNPNPLEQKQNYNKAPDGSTYSELHAKYHGILKKMIYRLGFSDIYLVNILTGEVVFNISKEIDFATNLLTGPLRKSNLAKIFKSIQQTSDENFVELIDHDFYTPSFETPNAFIGTPIYQEGKKIGALMFELPIDKINNIMTFNNHWQDVGLGKTGETFLIGQDKKMRTVSRSFIEDKNSYLQHLQKLQVPQNIINKMKIFNTTILLQLIDTQPARDIFNGITNIVSEIDYLDYESLIAFSPLNINGVSWGIITKMQTNEAFAPIKNLYKKILLIALLLLIFVIFFAFLFSRFLIKPSEEFEEVIRKHNGIKIDLEHPAKLTIGAIAENPVRQYNKLTKRIYNLFIECKEIQEDNNAIEKTLQHNIKEIISKNKKSEQQQEEIVDDLKDNNPLFDELYLVLSTQESQMEQLQTITTQVKNSITTSTKHLQIFQEQVSKAFDHYDHINKNTTPLNTYTHSLTQSIAKLNQQIIRAIKLTQDAKYDPAIDKNILQTIHTAIENHATDITQTIDKLEQINDELTKYINEMKPYLKHASSTSEQIESNIINAQTTSNAIDEMINKIIKQEIHSKQFTQQLNKKIDVIIDNMENITSLKNEIATLDTISKQHKNIYKKLTHIVNQIEW